MLVLQTRRQNLKCIVFSPDGNGLAAAGRLGAWWWKSFLDDPMPVRFGENNTSGVGFDPSRAYLIHVSPSNLRATRLAEQSDHRVPLRISSPLLSVCPATGLTVLGRDFSDWLSGWRIGADGRLVRRWGATAGWASGGPFVAFATDGAWFVRAERSDLKSRDFRLVIRDPAGGKALREIPAHDRVSCTPAVSADGSRIAYGSRHFLYCHWTDDPKKSVTVTNDSKREFTGVAFQPSGQYLAATSKDETV